ncbi:MAG TPA: SRPBCC domain-containing protein [Ignavibacteria bacterium]|jgi:uncharacterized protein YndB with AHSA1/START domain
MKNYNCKPLYTKTGNGSLHYKIGMQIRGELDKVWDNVTKSENLMRYFTSDAKKNLDTTGEVLWAWGENAVILNVIEVVPHSKIVLEWNGNMVEYKIRAEITFQQIKNKVLVKISESGWENSELGIKNALSNCNGWSDFLNALRVFTEYKISYLNK